MKDSSTRKRILLATIDSIERHGIEACTVRAIAAEAGVTLSSVHYYFESKETLVDQALEHAVTGSFEDAAEIWKASGQDAGKALSDILAYFLEGSLRYPGITRAGLKPLLMQGKADGLFVARLNAFLADLVKDLKPRKGIGRDALRLRLVQAFSSVLFAGIGPAAFAAFLPPGFEDDGARKRLVDSATRSVTELLAEG